MFVLFVYNNLPPPKYESMKVSRKVKIIRFIKHLLYAEYHAGNLISIPLKSVTVPNELLGTLKTITVQYLAQSHTANVEEPGGI